MSVDMEQVRRHAVAALQARLPSVLAAVDAEANIDGVSVETPVPKEIFDYPVFEESVVVWPICIVLGRRAPYVSGPNDQGHVIRRYELEVEVWFSDSDQAILGTWVERAARAVALILESSSTWDRLGTFNRRTVDALFSDVLSVETEFIRACQVQFALDGLEMETP